MNLLEQAFGAQAGLAMGLMAALGSGLLIGLERERHKGRGHAGTRAQEPAGLRTFTIAALAGALAHGLAVPGLVAVGALAITVLAAMAYFRSSERDPGLTTEMALLATYLIGVLCVQAPLLGTPAAVTLTALLSARTALHRFATRMLREDELHDGLLLAALALVVLPLMPTEPLPWLAGMKAHSLMGLMLLLLGLQAFGYVALRLLGAQTGLALSGLMSGLVSSTATIAAMGQRARAEPPLFLACAAGAVMSSAATWLQASLMLLALAPEAAMRFLPMGGAGIAVAGGAGLLLARQARLTQKAQASDAAPATAKAVQRGGPLRLKEAALIALLLSVVTVVVSWAEQRFGSSGLFGAVALTGLADAHAPVASLAGLAHAGQIDARLMCQGVLAAIASNSLTRSLTAWLAGGPRFALIVASVLFSSLALAAALLWLLLPFLS
ncbi:MgtC/SapB family protein [Paucibacter sp. DJ1R-11]|uniref:MgtC/SapB family protein n=1 Tax=Paucibacter sp. DJ1R-11 TaxID=2893556 RepID=UPI0021E3A234|nr:MgtC/SapB family protein [Paucibacter sp. DJ1R-11]MCV2364092.1 MgtC/SapB family protein [Paucibacter sp. DJ1R-11]